MSLIPVAEPQSESDLSMMLCLLEAEGIPAFVHSGGLGSLYPGVQIRNYNSRRVMVPEECREQAEAALSALVPTQVSAIKNMSWRDKFRIVVEFLLCGWFVYGYRRRKASGADPSADAAGVAVE